MAELKAVPLHVYLSKMTVAQRNDLADKLGKQNQYMTLAKVGRNRPKLNEKFGIAAELIKHSKKFPIDGCYLTKESMVIGYAEAKKDIEERASE